MSVILHFIRRLHRDDRGQDLVEYALLAVLVGIAGVALFPTISARIGVLFGERGTAVYNQWIPSDPATP